MLLALKRPSAILFLTLRVFVGKRTKQHTLCEVCGLHPADCLCEGVVPLELRTRVALVVHKREITRPTNTGRLSSLAYANASIHVRGYQDAPADLSSLASPERRILVLFPRDDARTLTAELLAEDERPITLIVPDGNWGQARRCVQREPIMRDAEAVIPPAGPPTQYFLRKEHIPGGLATAEAIGRAMRVIEGDEAGDAIERLFHEKVRRSLALRPGGLPPQR